MKFIVCIKFYSWFCREGNDFYVIVILIFLELFVGFKKNIDYFDGYKVDVGSNLVMKFKEVRKFLGEGMLLFESNKKGNFFVMFEVVFLLLLLDE